MEGMRRQIRSAVEEPRLVVAQKGAAVTRRHRPGRRWQSDSRPIAVAFTLPSRWRNSNSERRWRAGSQSLASKHESARHEPEEFRAGGLGMNTRSFVITTEAASES